MKTKLLSIGCNRKLGKKVAVFNLPQGKTCPGKTALCREICYAAKAERMYPAAAAMRARNLVAAEKDTFVDDMIAEITVFAMSGGTRVRFHESGDAYNQAYLNKLFQITEAFPSLTFLMYTKSFKLNWTCKPSNLMVYWSIDSSTHEPVPAGLTASIVLRGETPPAGAQTCIHTSNKHYCGTECHTCWLGRVNVYFPQH